MIESITINNYKSINQPLTISFENGKIFNLLFGANNSGKSIIIEAFDLIAKVFRDGLRSIDSIEHHTSTSFEFIFKINQKRYSYHVALDLEKGEVISEVFNGYRQNDSFYYFKRNSSIIENAPELSKLFTKFDYERLKTYMYDLRFDRKHLILSNLHTKNFSDSNKAYFLDQAALNIHQMQIYRQDEDIIYFSDIDNKHYTKVLELLKRLKTNVHSLTYQTIELDQLRANLNRHRYDHLMDTFRNKLTESNENVFFVIAYDQFYRLAGRNLNDLKIQMIEVRFENDLVLSLNAVSKGLRQLIVMMILTLRIKKDILYVVDDLTNHMDSKLAKEFLTALWDIFNASNSRLICSTHDMLLFDSNLFSLKEIVYIKNEHGTKLTYLDTLKIRKDKKLLNLYLDGYFDE